MSGEENVGSVFLRGIPDPDSSRDDCDLIIDDQQMDVMSTEVVEVEVTSEPLYCICQQPWDNNKRKFMIECDICHDWFHGSCVGLLESLAADIDKYHCPKCAISNGPSLLTEFNNLHRHDYTEKDADKKPIQAGTPLFIQKLKEKIFLNGEDILIRMRGEALTLFFVFNKGFKVPIVVDNISGLDIRVPNSQFSVRDVERFVGSDLMLDVIDVQKQSDNIKMTMKEFAEYFTSHTRTNRYNLLSLEFSKTNLSRLVEPPYIARKLDWTNNTWPSDFDEDILQRPQVSKYCLIGTKDSYTDFHIDFGGTSVWYHVLWGEKIFYLIEPTLENLTLYQRWMASTTQYETFFPDMVQKCYRYVLKKGETFFIPTGWIHGVLTPEDSLVFGGNFLNSLNVDLQLRVYEIEKKLKTASKYLFPSFEASHWFAAEKFINELQSFNNKSGMLPTHLYDGAKELLNAFRIWNHNFESGKEDCEDIPASIVPLRIIKNLSKELKATRKRLDSLDGVKVPSPQKKGLPKYKEDLNNLKNGDHLSEIKAKLKLLASNDRKEKAQEISEKPSIIQAPIKLKFKKQPSLSTSRASSPPPYIATISENGSIDHEDSNASQGGSGDGRIKIRLSLSDNYSHSNNNNKVRVVEESPSYFLDSDPELQIDTDDEEDKKKKKKKNKDKNGKGKAILYPGIDEELAGTLVGIDELIQDSNYSERINSYKETPDSMKEAIHGMITIEDSLLLKKNKRKRESNVFDDIDQIEKVHQDDDFIYLPLAGGSDDEEDLYNGRHDKRKKADEEDQSWNPKIKLRVSEKRESRPHRFKAKRHVEKGLEKAAAKLATIPPSEFKRKYKKKKSSSKNPEKHHHHHRRVEMDDSESPGSSSTIKKSHHHHHHVHHHSTNDNFSRKSVSSSTRLPIVKKPKKGMATPKQRLGKILKLNKMAKF